jgi:two-component system, cell cycle sensor histidine kinase and response regulator CckA
MSPVTQPPGTGIAELLDALGDLGCAYALVASTGALLDVNEALAAMVGYSREELLTLSGVTDLVSPEDREQVAGDIALRLRGMTGPLRRRSELLARDGRRIPVSVATAAPTSGAETQVICVFHSTPGDAGSGEGVDEARLQSAWARLEKFVAASPVIIVEGRAGEIAWDYISPNVERILGYGPDEVVGQPDWIRQHTHPDDLPQAVACLKEALEQRAEECEARVRYLHRDGTFRWFRLIIRIDYDAGGAARTLGYHIDITEQVEGAREREMLRAQLDRVRTMEAVGQLAGGIAHDFNNLLMVIVGYAEQLAARTGDPGIVGDAIKIQEAVQKGATLTRRLLTFASGGTKRGELQDLNEIVSDLGSLLRTLGENIELEVHLAPDLWVVRADAAHLQQVIVNMAINARDAMPAGGILTVTTENAELDEVWCSVRPRLAPGRYVRLSVSDTGIGMSPEIQARAFEPFFTTKEVGRGSGLGLASAYGMVTGAGGTIELTSQEGFGTSVDCYFPAVYEPATPKRISTGDEPSSGRGEHILLVEDEEAVRTAIRRTLVDSGYVVLEAAGPAEAMALARVEGEISLLLTDIVMPRMSGVDLARWVSELRPGIPIVFMSGYTADFLAREGSTSGAVHLLQKPFTRARLLAMLRLALEVGSGIT